MIAGCYQNSAFHDVLLCSQPTTSCGQLQISFPGTLILIEVCAEESPAPAAGVEGVVEETPAPAAGVEGDASGKTVCLDGGPCLALLAP